MQLRLQLCDRRRCAVGARHAVGLQVRPVSLPKSEEAVPPTVMPERMAKALDAKGKVAAKAA